MQSTQRQASFFKKLLQALMAVGSTATLSQILVMLQTLVLARWIGPELNAYVLAAFNVAGLGFILINWGFDNWLLQRTALDQESSHKNLAMVLSVKLLFGTVLGIIFLILLPIVRPEIYIPIILALALLDVLTDSLCASSYTYLYASDQYKRASITLSISRILRLLSTIALIFLKVRTLPWFLGLRLLIDLGTLAYLWLIIKPKIKLVKFHHIQSLIKQTWSFGLAEILNFAYDRIDLTLLAFLSLINVEISYYGTTSNILYAGLSILIPLQYVLVPYIINQNKSAVNGDARPNKNTLYVQPLLLLLGMGLLGSLFLYFFAEPAINLVMGKAYAPAGPLLRLASPIVLLRAGTVALSSFLIARQRQELKLLPLGIVTLLKIILISVLYKTYGLEGMILIFIFCELVLLILYAIQLLRTRGQTTHETHQSDEAPSA